MALGGHIERDSSGSKCPSIDAVAAIACAARRLTIQMGTALHSENRLRDAGRILRAVSPYKQQARGLKSRAVDALGRSTQNDEGNCHD